MPDNDIERRSSDLQLGYLTGRVEDIEHRLSSHMKAEEAMQEKIGEQLSRIESQLSMYRHLAFFLRTLAIILAAILSANWAEVKSAWHSFFYGGHM